MANELKTNVSARTVRNTLHSHAIHARVAAQKPQLTKLHKKAKLEWALKNVSNSVETWNNIIWSDESRFRSTGCDEKQMVWRMNGERLNDKCIKKTLKFGGGSIMVWDVFRKKV